MIIKQMGLKMNIFRKNVLLMFLTLSLFCLCSFSLHSEVFLFGGGRGGKAWGVDLLGGSKLWSEPAVINGVKSSVQLVLLKKQIDECYKILKNKFPNAKFRFNKESILVEIKRENGNLERIYLVNMGGAYPVLQFSMEIPVNLPKNPRWPEELPALNNSIPVTVINLTNRGTLYGAFTSLSNSEQLVNEMDSNMLSDGWKSMGKGVYLKDNPTRMVLISATDDKNGKAHGFVLKRNLSSK